MKRFKINYDPKRYYRKTDVCMTSVNYNVKNNIITVTLEEMAELVGDKGHAFTRALLEGGRKEENFVEQNFLVLDFDNGFTYPEFKERCKKYHLSYAFTYKTLSCSRTDFRFRAVFVMNQTITNVAFAKAMNELLFRIFPEADKMCQDIPRVMLGGKGVIDISVDSREDVLNIVYAAQDHMGITQPNNYRRNLQRLAKKIGVKIYNNSLGFVKQDELPENMQESIIVQEDIVMICQDENSSRIENSKYDKDSSGEDLHEVRGYDEKGLKALCPLLKDYIDAEADLPHEYKFLLASSLCHISGGKTIFFKYLKEHEKKWKGDWDKYLVYHFPKRCEGVCPYFGEKCNCASLYQKISSKIVRTSSLDEYFPLEICEEELRQSLRHAVDSPENAIFVIKGQTAIGKTEVYCRMIQERKDKKFLIAVPTCKLQQEIVDRLEEKGVGCCMTESMIRTLKRLGLDELFDRVMMDYEIGFGKQARKRVRVYYMEHQDELNPYQKEGLKKLLGRKEKITSERCIVTTHAYFLMMDLDELEDYEIIIDEDLLMTLLKKSGEVPIKDIDYAIKNNLLVKKNKELLKDILKMKDEDTRQVDFVPLTDSQMQKMIESDVTFQGPMPLLLESTCVAMAKARESVLFYHKTELPKRKLIVLSASADKKLYEDYFRDHIVCFLEIHKAKYKGKFKQYTAYSMSRRCIRMYGNETIDRYIKKITGDVKKISFKMFDKEDGMHFGKTEGYDEYKGKNLAVIGTPHILTAFYKLIGEALGYHTKDMLCKRRINRNDYSFSFMTFSDEDMRNLQLFFIETELEQAIGRARALRYECTVYLFSNYPCEQAELIEDRFLPDIQGEVEDETEEDL